MKIKVEEASASQLAHFARVNLGLEVDHRRGRDNILSALAATGWSETEIEVEDSSETRAQEAVPKAPEGPRKMVKIMIPNQNEPGGKDAVVVGVNGRVVRIMRGVPVDVPEEYVKVLQTANKGAFEKGENGQPINASLIPTHSFSILSA